MGRIGRDVVLLVDDVPDPGASVRSHRRLEMLGGKGANQALALTQLGIDSALIGVVGDDDAGEWLLDAASADGLDLSSVVVRPDTETSLIVSLVDSKGSWRYVEDLPEGTFVQAADVEDALPMIRASLVTSLQMQEPADALLVAARAARAAGRTVVADGVPGSLVEELMSSIDVLRADGHEAELLVRNHVRTAGEALESGRRLLERGPRLVVLGAGDDGDVAVWPGAGVVVPHQSEDVVDATGGGDAMTAGLVAAVLREPGDSLTAVALGACAAASVVGRLGGRPDLDGSGLWAWARRLAGKLKDEVRVLT